MDVYGKFGNKKCGEVRNIQNKYTPGEDHCFNMVNKKYRYTEYWWPTNQDILSGFTSVLRMPSAKTT